MKSILKKEIKIYFSTPMGWVFVGVMMCVSAILFTILNLFGASSSLEGIFSILPWLYVIMIPLLTMRLIAEERALKTDQLLLTSPISVADIVIGKFLSASFVLLVSTLLMLIYPFILSIYSVVSWGIVFSNYLAFFLLGISLIGVGIFISSLTESQIISAVLTIAIFLSLFVFSVLDVFTGIKIVDIIISVFAIFDRFTKFYYGIVCLGDVLYYLSICTVFLALSWAKIENRKIK